MGHRANHAFGNVMRAPHCKVICTDMSILGWNPSPAPFSIILDIIDPHTYTSPVQDLCLFDIQYLTLHIHPSPLPSLFHRPMEPPAPITHPHPDRPSNLSIFRHRYTSLIFSSDSLWRNFRYAPSAAIDVRVAGWGLGVATNPRYGLIDVVLGQLRLGLHEQGLSPRQNSICRAPSQYLCLRNPVGISFHSVFQTLFWKSNTPQPS